MGPAERRQTAYSPHSTELVRHSFTSLIHQLSRASCTTPADLSTTGMITWPYRDHEAHAQTASTLHNEPRNPGLDTRTATDSWDRTRAQHKGIDKGGVPHINTSEPYEHHLHPPRIPDRRDAPHFTFNHFITQAGPSISLAGGLSFSLAGGPSLTHGPLLSHSQGP